MSWKTNKNQQFWHILGNKINIQPGPSLKFKFLDSLNYNLKWYKFSAPAFQRFLSFLYFFVPNWQKLVTKKNIFLRCTAWTRWLLQQTSACTAWACCSKLVHGACTALTFKQTKHIWNCMYCFMILHKYNVEKIFKFNYSLAKHYL